MSEITVSWGEITIGDLIDLTKEMNGALEIDGDHGIARIIYEAIE